VLLTDPSWLAPQLLTPVRYHGHQLYLCVEEGLTVVLHHAGPGRWQYVRTPAQLAQLAAQPPLPPASKRCWSSTDWAWNYRPPVPHSSPRCGHAKRRSRYAAIRARASSVKAEELETGCPDSKSPRLPTTSAFAARPVKQELC
jgi:hypothetical protein